MTKSYKMLVLLAMLQLDRMPGSIRIEEFRYLGLSNIVDRERFGMLVRELVEWRLAKYLDRSGQQEGHRCRIIHSDDRPIIRLPSRSRVENLPLGFLPIRIEDKDYVAKFAQEYINVVIETQESRVNILGDLLRGWYGSTVGQRGTRFEVQLVEDADGWYLRKL